MLPKRTQKVMLLILDGYGLRDSSHGNAVKLADTPFLHGMCRRWPSAQLTASGEAVGLPAGQMGNSEVGHLNLGAGRIVYQDITRIDLAIKSGEFFSNPAIAASVGHAAANGVAWHLIGLVSDGGVHSSLEHLFALLDTASRAGAEKVFVHVLTDGRDTSPNGAERYVQTLEEKMAQTGVGRIATVCGRYWAMDRDQRWQRTERAYRMLTKGEGHRYESALQAIRDSYRRQVTDEFIEPSLVINNGHPVGLIQERDGVFFFNFRADRARQLTQAFTASEFDKFPRQKMKLHWTTLTRYREDFNLPTAFAPQTMNDLLGGALAEAGRRQCRIAETEKYAHVTYFFNGGDEAPFAGEERFLIPSPKVATYDLQPQMSAPEVAKAGLDAISNGYDFILLNFANPDMVGHTGVIPAAVEALEALEPLVKSLVERAQERDYCVLITADHGNCEQMLEDDGSVHTAHTTNPVPFVLVGLGAPDITLREGGILADVAPTILDIMGIPQPTAMTGQSLLSGEAP